MNRKLVIAIAVALLLGCTMANAAIVAVGDPMSSGGNSWTQGFGIQESVGGEFNGGEFNRVGVRMSPYTGAFKDAVFSNFSLVGWANAPILPFNAVSGSATYWGLAKAPTSVTDVSFNINFYGPSSRPLQFDIAAWYTAPTNEDVGITIDDVGDTLEVVHAIWDGAGGWSIDLAPIEGEGAWLKSDSYYWEVSAEIGYLEPPAAVPEPASVVIWSVLGTLAAVVAWRRTR